jgi:cell division septation protein DedD
MAQDFAKRKQTAGGKKAPARKQSTRRKPAGKKPTAAAAGGWRWYFTGILTGFFLSFLLYLGTLPTPGDTAQEPQNGSQAAKEPPRPRFDFYTLLPEQTMDVEVEPAPELASPTSSNVSTDFYLLQAGSFRQQEDAERRRAELLLLGLEPKVEETSGDNGRWFRVYVGPFDSHSKMARARSLTANQNIDTLLLKRSKP